MGTRVVVTSGPVDPEIAGLAGAATVVGDPPQWADDSDATYGRITTWSSGISGVTAVNACHCDLLMGGYAVPTGVKVRMRLAAETSDVPYPTLVHVRNWFTGVDTLTVAGPGTVAPMTPTWVEWTFTPVNGGYEGLVADLAVGQAQVRVLAGEKYGPTSSGVDEFRYTRIYEVVIVLEGIPTVAPPCQNFPRDDRLGVGAAQNYPPPKSQQGGARNFGYW